jgi:hypothetical protein
MYYKGNDRAQIVVTGDTATPERDAENTHQPRDHDEIKQFADCRYIGPCQAFHRISGFPLHGAKPPVVRLSVHLPNEQIVYYEEGQEEEITNQTGPPPSSQLLEFFKAVHDSANITPVLNYKRASEVTYQELPQHYTWQSKGRKVWSPRKQQFGNYPVIGRMYQIAPTAKNSELYYLRMLLTRVKGPRGFEDLRTFDGEVYPTFQEACRARGILQDDQEWINCLHEACATMTNIHKLRELFVIILFYNNPANPRLLWDTFKKELSEDYRYQRVRWEQMRPHVTTTENYLVQDFDAALYDIQTILAESHYQNKTLRSFLLPDPITDRADLPDYVLQRQQEENDQEIINTVAELEAFTTMYDSMNPDQKIAIDTFIDACNGIEDATQSKCYFLDAPGGTGKTFVLNAFIHYCRSKQYNTIVTAFSGVAANLLIGGRTCHSQFKFPLNQDSIDCQTGHLKNTEPLGKRLYEAQVIIIDEGPMMHRKYWELLHYSCLDLYKRRNALAFDYTTPYAGKMIICSGDLRQCLPVIRHGDRTNIVQNVMNRSYLWSDFHILHLTVNERVMRHTAMESAEVQDQCRTFASNILRIGNGNIPFFQPDDVTIEVTDIVHARTTEETPLSEFVKWCYPELGNTHNDTISIYDKAILCSLNEDVDEVNKITIQTASGEGRKFFSADELTDKDDNNSQHIPIEFLNSLTSSGIPPHELELKIGCPVILVRNINPKIGLCNGTKLVITAFPGQYTIEAEIVSGTNRGNKVILPRINFLTNESDFPFEMRRRQFPIRLAYAMTINKAQGQSLRRVGIYLKHPVFSHGQLYVALSRAGIPWETRCLFETNAGQQGKTEEKYVTANVVWKEVFLNL